MELHIDLEALAVLVGAVTTLLVFTERRVRRFVGRPRLSSVVHRRRRR